MTGAHESDLDYHNHNCGVIYLYKTWSSGDSNNHECPNVTRTSQHRDRYLCTPLDRHIFGGSSNLLQLLFVLIFLFIFENTQILRFSHFLLVLFVSVDSQILRSVFMIGIYFIGFSVFEILLHDMLAIIMSV